METNIQQTQNKSSLITQIKQTDKHNHSEYICQRIFKNKPQLCRIAMSYIMDDDQDIQVSKQNKDTKRRHRRIIPKYPHLDYSNKNKRPKYDFQKTPINQFLNYELSQQINFGLKEVKVLADEIKQIKVEKQKQSLEVEVKRNYKRIRIRPTKFKNKVLFKANSAVILR